MVAALFMGFFHGKTALTSFLVRPFLLMLLQSTLFLNRNVNKFIIALFSFTVCVCVCQILA